MTEAFYYFVMALWTVYLAASSYRLAQAWRRLGEARDRLTESQVAALADAGRTPQ